MTNNSEKQQWGSQTAGKPAVFNTNLNFSYILYDALSNAKQSNKNILIEFGGDWCIWCLRMHKVLKSKKFDSFISQYLIHIRCPVTEDGNYPYPPEMDTPHIGSIPHFIVLDKHGNIIHSQDTPKFELFRFYKKNALYKFIERCAKM